MTVRIYVEGGGATNATQGRCREGFAEYCKKVAPNRRLMIVACGSRNETFDRFKTGVKNSKPGDQCVLLVDSEGPVRWNTTPTTHLYERDGWDFAHLPSHLVFLMVQAMEAWLLADRNALSLYYGAGFRINALPGDERNIEAVLKVDLEPSLQNASRDTRTKGRYHKTRHAFALLAEVDPAKVEAGSPHAAEFNSYLRQL